ncbi:hypothetical protein [Methylobrevis pamukkalensis]|uniref:Alpha/beta hydrolase family protein n=1 Tax=Methylobrevis pamukkalensis TaxID=1439726 RepID=A0A1E3GN73_9HYPH|nr:hypothetical protein [Methylobrevis pamukkalensis]ODN65457.1 hypothetical protein A6302_04533 [Methylobrevis pamukkalensis]
MRLAPVSFGLTKYARLHREVRRRFDLLRQRNVRLALVFSADDGGLDELSTYFGPEGRALAAYPNVSLAIVPDADHNMTPKPARDALLGLLTAFAKEADDRAAAVARPVNAA